MSDLAPITASHYLRDCISETNEEMESAGEETPAELQGSKDQLNEWVSQVDKQIKWILSSKPGKSTHSLLKNNDHETFCDWI